jgi:hypothetical protein
MTKLWVALIVTAIAGGYGMEAMGQGQGGGNHEVIKDNPDPGDREFTRYSDIPVAAVLGLLHSSGAVNTHGQKGLIGGSGGGDDFGNDSGDTLGGNADAGGWGGEKP